MGVDRRVKKQDEFRVADPTVAPIAEPQAEYHPDQALESGVSSACGLAAEEADAADTPPVLEKPADPVEPADVPGGADEAEELDVVS